VFPPLFRILIFALPLAFQKAVASVESGDVIHLTNVHWRLFLGFSHLDAGGRQLIVIA